MGFEEIYILKSDDNECLGQISYDEHTNKWFFMPNNKVLLLDDINKIQQKINKLMTTEKFILN